MASDITQNLRAARAGDEAALEALYGQVYDELRTLARRQLRRLRGGPLQTTEVVNEAYLRLCKQVELGVKDRAHFYAVSARAMRQVLIDHFRSRNAEKRGGSERALTLDEGRVPVAERGAVLLDLDEALQRLATLDPRLARVVELKFFGGMTESQIGLALEVSERTVRGDWRKAKAWLSRALSEESGGER
ncbi:MAG: ECF-type sigma factor [Acidobacteriota bacterium]|nr:ECF-type sigma factor [Acidobacteriota bacterium]MDH3524708.1 ECF-type sigma factor [Acidobacteriota bacterium]